MGTVARGAWRATNGELFVVVGPNVYFVTSAFGQVLLGTIADAATPVAMCDNGLTLVLVDGSPAGYSVTLSGHAFAAISDPAFYGADRVDFVDTFFIFNRPGTNQFYISPPVWVPGIPFDPLDIAAKEGFADKLSGVICMHREIWLIGELTSEIWFNSGAADFAFAAMPGAYVEHGCVAKYSICKEDLNVFWLGQDLQGHVMVLRGSGYQAHRISTHAIEDRFRKFAVVSDAIGFTYQQDGHVFYVLTFPTADETWVWDAATELWHQRAWVDADGILHRHRANCCAFAYGTTVVGDHTNGNLYAWDLDALTDEGNPIPRIRSFPHLVNDGKRVSYSSFTADMEAGSNPGTTIDAPALVSLRYSDDRGVSYSNAIEQSLGSAGQYLVQPQWQRLGMARDRVFELSWTSSTLKTALQGAWITTESAET